MSNLKQQPSPNTAVLRISRPYAFEDVLQSAKFSPYDLLELSALRAAHGDGVEEQAAYHQQLVALVAADVTPLPDAQAAAFHWKLGDDEYASTSLLFELYCTTLSLAHSALDTLRDYKSSTHLLQQCKNILGQWNTANFVFPSCPHVCSHEYLTNLLYLSNGTMMLSVRDGHKKGLALSTAMNYCGNVPFRLGHYSELALSHYLIARALLYSYLSLSHDELGEGGAANQSLTAAEEALDVASLVDRSVCHSNNNLEETLNALIADMPEHISMLKDVYYATPISLTDVPLPQSVNNDKIEAR